jgi:hypothetical protein
MGQRYKRNGKPKLPIYAKKKMEKFFNVVPFGIFASHHTLHNAGWKCRKKQYLKEQ